MIKSCKKPPVYFPTVTGDICSFNSQYAGLPLKSHKIALTATQSGSGVPSPQNIRNINGHSVINIYHTNQNLIVPEQQSGSQLGVDFVVNADKSISTTGKASAFIGRFAQQNVNLKKNIPYYLSGGINNNKRVYLYNPDLGSFVVSATDEVTYTPTDDVNCACYYSVARNQVCDNDIYKPMLSLQSGIDYVNPSNNVKYTINLGGTYYGGEYDARTGVLTVTHGISTFKGLNEEGWNISGEGTSRRFRIELNGSDNTQSISDRFSWVSSNSGVWGKFRIASNQLLLLDNTSVMADVSALKTWLSNNNASFVYSLAEPFDIPLGGINLLTQQGVNNIFADCGNTTLEYLKAGR